MGGPPRKLLPNSLRTSISALRIEGRSNVNSASTTRNFKNNAMELICSMRSTLSLFNLKRTTLWKTVKTCPQPCEIRAHDTYPQELPQSVCGPFISQKNAF